MKHIGFIIFPEFNLLDLSGPLTVFETANHHLKSPYTLSIHTKNAGVVYSSSQVPITAQPLPEYPLDTLVVVGGTGVTHASKDNELVAFIGNQTRAKRHVSVCTGTFLLAASGILEGRRATTHWYRASELGRLYPDIKMEPDRIVVQDGNIWSSAGATAGMDIALALLGADQNQALVDIVCRELLIPQARTSGQLRFMPLNQLNPPSPRIQRVLSHICTHYALPLTVEVLAEQAHLSSRQFSREFRNQTGLTPAKAVELVRVDNARHLVETTNRSLGDIARNSGFSDESLMRKSFLRCLKLTPKQVRMAQFIE